MLNCGPTFTMATASFAPSPLYGNEFLNKDINLINLKHNLWISF